jgi:hypothetical protein
MLVAGRYGRYRRGSQPGLFDAEVVYTAQYLLKQDPEFEANIIGCHPAVLTRMQYFNSERRRRTPIPNLALHGEAASRQMRSSTPTTGMETPLTPKNETCEAKSSQ